MSRQLITNLTNLENYLYREANQLNDNDYASPDFRELLLSISRTISKIADDENGLLIFDDIEEHLNTLRIK